MNFTGKLGLVASVAVAVTTASLRAEEAQPASANPPAPANPYSTITARNVFALVPIPPPAPVDTTPPDPPIKLTPNGIMNVFGQLEVIFKAAIPAKGKEPAHDQSYVMAEGEREDDIEVVKIDDKASVITFVNHGIKQDLALADAPTITSPAASPPGGPGGGVPMPTGVPSPIGTPNRPMHRDLPPNSPAAARARAMAAAGMNDFSAPPGGGGGGGAVNTSGATQATTELTPEEQVINTEKQRAALLDEGNPASAIVPPTALTKTLTGEDHAPGAGNGPGVP
ncbi:MAG TPA: hypothetical protein VK742_05700 [Candidatus Sulfotelmatobacter sp.]|jgi:hypothetical protein|nr:hypothetical protein [Candidatus Sulfotelmatobacter sp.]